MILTAAATLCLALPTFAQAQMTYPEPQRIVSGLSGPWSVGFLPGGGLLITEKRGRLLRISPDGERAQVSGLPEIRVKGQGGLLDLALASDFASSGRIYLSYVTPQPGGEGTAVASATLEGATLEDVRTIFEMKEGSNGGRHFGGRIVEESQTGALFLTIGDRGDRPSAQDPARDNGKIIRIDPATGSHETWTMGHRNPQGLAFAPDGTLWSHEHGARGGDEINRIETGKNYGWPVIAYGRHYSGAKIGEGTSKPGLEQPAFYWDPSIAPSGMAIHSGEGWPEMKGRMFIGSLKFDHIAVMAPSGAEQIGKIETPQTQRVRDVRIGPRGGIWFLSEGRGALYRIGPPE
ncbi:PQQ-dependent sugar dehydrogenase [Rhodobacteraceae bacterium 63075]|nr:PQQ-dependent sugar dehydrogenase [Rhodobacteraceae bacterium 63075]